MLAAVLPITQVATLGPQPVSTEFITYFGFGSLVNRATRPVDEVAHPARLYGWRRVWGHRVLSAQQPADEPPRSCCSLSVEKLTNADALSREEQPFIDGVVVTIPIGDLPLLDKREAGYDRHAIPRSDFDLPAEIQASEVQVYVSRPTHHGFAAEQFPILQSYIDCVLAGYCELFEHTGMQRFVDSTVGWDGVIENERHKPKYPRAVTLPAEQLALFDKVVAAKRMNVKQEKN